MKEEQVQRPRRRRTRAEAAQLVAEYEASGLSRIEFCQEHGLALVTLNRYRKRDRVPGGDARRWVAVELTGGETADGDATRSGLSVVLTQGRRIEVGRRFDAAALEQLVRVLERI